MKGEMSGVTLPPSAPKRTAQRQIFRDDNLVSSIEKRSLTAREPELHQVGAPPIALPSREDPLTADQANRSWQTKYR